LETGIYDISLLRSGDPGRQGTLIYVVTVDTSQHGHARHTHLGSYHGYLKYMCVLYFRCYARSLRGNPNKVYRFILFQYPATLYVITVIDRLRNPCDWILYIGDSCLLMAVHGTLTFSLVRLPVIWRGSVELHIGSVAYGSEGLTMLKYNIK